MPGRPLLRLVEAIDAAGLTGRGGGGYPTGRKLAAVARTGKAAVVVANGTEGEPVSGKDGVVCALLPHLVIDGALWAAAAVGADRVVIAVDRTNEPAIRALQAALGERARHEPAVVGVELSLTPPRYVAGEERALVRFVTKGIAQPTADPARPAERGVDGRPTLVQNVETLAHVAQIATWGPAWFRAAGTTAEPGTALHTVSGAVAQPGIVEAPLGTAGVDILAMAGGPTVAIQAALVGGFFGTWVPASALDGPHSRAGLSPWGASPGCGVLVALPASACALAETARIMAWYAAESAGQCGPCVHGLRDLATGTASLAARRSAPATVDQFLRWAGQIEGRGACRHPDGAVRLLRSALSVFGADLAAHRAGAPCAGSAAPPVVPVPRSQEGWR
jgi:NADH:ubiquinone oxidoreductase subunit F (NADH-binding)